MRTRAGILLVLLGCTGVATVPVLISTSDATGDPFDSSLYWWTWLVLPAVAAAAAFADPSTKPIAWIGALYVPVVLGVAYIGTIGHDPDDGASLWMAGEMFVVVQATLSFGAAGVARRQRLRTVRSPLPPRPAGRA
jgi:hypothetical protein